MTNYAIVIAIVRKTHDFGINRYELVIKPFPSQFVVRSRCLYVGNAIDPTQSAKRLGYSHLLLGLDQSVVATKKPEIISLVAYIL